MKIVAIYFDYFPKSLKNRLKEYNINVEFIKSDDLLRLQYIPDIIIIFFLFTYLHLHILYEVI